MKKMLPVVLLGLLLLPSSLIAQSILVRGIVSDKETGETLPAATVRIEGTMRGTISNTDGEFVIDLEELPSTLIVRFIGYASQRIEIASRPTSVLHIKLSPIVLDGGEIVFTGKDYGLSVMERVIARKQLWRGRLSTYIAEAYTRQRVENDTGIVSITETVSEAYWDAKRGTKEVIKSKRQTNNVSADQNFASATTLPNMYDDDIRISGFQMIGVTHPKALDYYDFKIEGSRYLDDKLVYDIRVTPKSKLQPTFKGRVSVLDKEFAMIDVDLTPNESMLFPPPIQEFRLHYKQQFDNFGFDAWLPVDARIDGTIRIGFPGLQFPKIIFNQVSRLTRYQVNVPLPDSLYVSQEGGQRRSSRFVDATATTPNADSLMTANPDAIPLDKREELAYQRIDTISFEQAFKPKGALAKMVVVDDGTQRNRPQKKESTLSKVVFSNTPQLWYNRTEGAHLGIKRSDKVYQKLHLNTQIGYKFGSDRYAYGVGLELKNLSGKMRAVELRYYTDAQERQQSDQYIRPITSLQPLLGGEDYFDYFWKEGIEAKVRFRHRFRRRTLASLELGALTERHESMAKITNYSIPSGYIQRENPAIQDGRLTALKARFDLGDSIIPFGALPFDLFRIDAEWSPGDAMASDFTYARFDGSIYWHTNTFLKRRLQPNTLEIRAHAGTFVGDLPLQRYRGLDGALRRFTPVGTFRTLVGRPYDAASYAALFWEHNFRTVPFELMGLDFLAKKFIAVIVFGGHGKTMLPSNLDPQVAQMLLPSQGVHHEIGASINGIFSLMRVDFAYRLDQPSFYIGFNVARVF